MYMSKMNGAYSEGLGGAKTLRGILRNRIVGDGIVYGNFEFRWKVFSTVWFNQNFYFALSTFFDTGRVIKDFEVNLSLNWTNVGAGDENFLTDYGILVNNLEDSIDDEEFTITVPQEKLEASVSLI